MAQGQIFELSIQYRTENSLSSAISSISSQLLQNTAILYPHTVKLWHHKLFTATLCSESSSEPMSWLCTFPRNEGQNGAFPLCYVSQTLIKESLGFQ